MAINDISLTSGMRSNLISLQGTVDLLNRTQDRLSTGKKVNTALDNPLNYFTAKALNSRAGDLDSYKDAMSEAVQTIKAANAGISAIEGLIAQAKAVAATAKAASTVTAADAYDSLQLTVDGAVSGKHIQIGGATFTASSCAYTASTSFCAQDATISFYVGDGSDNDLAAQNLFSAITTMMNACSAATGLATEVAVSGNVITLSNATTDLALTLTTDDPTMSENLVSAMSSDRATYLAQYNTIRAQIDLVATDSGYKGVNFLGSDSLDVYFGTATTDFISVQGFDASAATLLGTAQADWSDNTKINLDVAKMTAAENTLKTQTSTLSSGLSIINVRQDWVKGMVNTLTEGADKLTLADMNEEGANMLMLQTRQTLGTTALSLSAQAAQSVLRLFA